MTTETKPTTTTSTAFDRSLFIAAVAAVLTKAFDPGDAQDAAALSIPASVCTADERRVYCLLSAQLYAGDGKPATALAWRVRHAFEAGVIGSPSKFRFAAREVAGDAIATAERETRQVQRRMASDRIAERQVKATERLADAVETMLQVFVMNTGKGQDLADIKAAFAALTEKRAEVRAAEAKAAAEKAEAKAKAAAEAEAKAEAKKAA
jgi:hypothetical protein